MRCGAAQRVKKPARLQRHEVVGSWWNRQRGLGQNGGAWAAARAVMPADHCTPHATCNHPSTSHEVSWNGSTARGQRLPNGLYLVRIRLGTQTLTHKAILSH